MAVRRKASGKCEGRLADVKGGGALNTFFVVWIGIVRFEGVIGSGDVRVFKMGLKFATLRCANIVGNSIFNGRKRY